MDFVQMADNLMLAEDEFLKLVRLFLEVTTRDLLRLDQAYRGDDLTAAAAAAHSIKGAAANLGFAELAATAAGIERSARQGDSSQIVSGSASIRASLSEIRSEL